MKAKPNVIKTNRLILKDISLIDQEAFIDIICNEEVSLTYMVPTFKDKQEIINLFNRFIKLSNDENRFVYGIYLNNKLIGLINDVEINNDEIELGYVISPIYKNNGYATEALSNCINTYFYYGCYWCYICLVHIYIFTRRRNKCCLYRNFNDRIFIRRNN